MPKVNKFKKDMTPKQYLAYLERKARNPSEVIEEDRVAEAKNIKTKPNKKVD